MMRIMMKKSCFLLFVCAAACAMSLAGAVRAEGEMVEVVAVSGEARMLISGQEEWKDLAEDMFLLVGDAVETGPDSYVELIFDEEGDNVLRLESDTTAVFVLEDSEKVELTNGEIFSTINNIPEGSSFEIRTPTAVCGVRGTDWLTRVEGEKTEIETVEGAAYVKGYNRDGTLMEEMAIEPGTITAVHKFMPPIKISEIPLDRRKRLTELKHNIHLRAQDVLEERKAMPGEPARIDRMRDVRHRVLIMGEAPRRERIQGLGHPDRAPEIGRGDILRDKVSASTGRSEEQDENERTFGTTGSFPGEPADDIDSQTDRGFDDFSDSNDMRSIERFDSPSETKGGFDRPKIPMKRPPRRKK